MSLTRKFIHAALSFTMILSMTLSLTRPQPAAAQGGDGIQRDYNTETGKVSHITGAGDEPITIMGAMSADMTSAERSDVLVERFAPEFGLIEPSEELRLAEESQPEADRVVSKYQQVYQDVPVIGGELIVNASDTGQLHSMNGEVAQGLALDTTPTITAEEAQANALQIILRGLGGASSDYIVSTPELWVFDESLLRPSTRPAELVWRMEVTSADGTVPLRELVLVNAQTGNVSLHFNQTDTGWEAATVDPIERADEENPTESPTPLPSETPTPIETPIQTETILPDFTATPLPTIQPTATGATTSSSSEGSMSILSGATWYVKTNGSDFNSCSTPTSSCQTIQRAINKAANGDTINVGEGTYRYTSINTNPNVVVLNKSLTLSGGWQSNFSSQTGISIIDGENTNNGILVTAPGNSVVDKFIIQNSVSSDSGAIYHLGTNLTLKNSTLKNNTSGRGAGIFVTNNAALTVLNSTISNNSVSSSGGGIYVVSGTVTINNSTIAHNSSNSIGGGITRENGTISIKNSILAKNTATGSAPDCSGSITSSDHNIISTTAGCAVSSGPGDQFNVDPLISSSLSGTMPVHVLLVGSPAIDSGDSATCLADDQRGIMRPQGSGCDLGAYELVTSESINVYSGSNQVARISTAFSLPLVVRLVDNVGDPASGVMVTFTAPASGASGTFADTSTNVTTAITNDNGYATSSVFAANSQAGGYDVSATAVGYNFPALFSLANSLPGFYVSPNGLDSNSCNSPSSPCASIQKAVNTATSGDFIYVADGTYYRPSINTNPNVVVINKSLTLSGGWKDNFASQNGISIVDGEYGIGGSNKNNNGMLITSGNVVIERFAVQNSVASDSGGFYIAGGANVTLRSSSVRNNHAHGKGAGIFLDGNARLTLINVTIGGNSAVLYGGGIYYGGANSLTIQNSTIAYNTGEGGGIYRGSSNTGTISLKNTILANNNDGYGDCNGKIDSATNSIFSSTLLCTITTSTNNKLDVNPQIASNMSGIPPVYILFAGGPAVDEGDATGCPSADAQGYARPIDGNNDGIAKCDIGAYEFHAMPGVPAVVSITGGNIQQQSINQPFNDPLAVAVIDNVGNPVNGSNVTFTAPSSGPSGVFANGNSNSETVTTNASGIATSSIFTANGTVGGPYTVTATVAGLETSVNFSLRNLYTLGVPTRINVYSGSNQKKLINQAFDSPLVVRVLDGNPIPVSGASVTFTAPSSGASGLFSSNGTVSETVLTDSAGYAISSTFTANGISNSYNVTATVAGVSQPASFALQNLAPPGIARSIRFTRGGNQKGIPNHPFYTPLTVRVLDDYSNPVNGASITFTVVPNGASGTFANNQLTETTITDNNGYATTSHLTANGITGTFNVSVFVSEVANVASTTLSIQNISTQTYTANHTDSLPGSLLCNQSTDPCTELDVDANRAHSFALGTLNLYLSKHGRNSLDNNNMTVMSTVHYCLTNLCPFPNAFWSGAQMVYGDKYGFANADDIVAHELTHGVTDSASGLFYVYQSGAINESFSDLWGEYYDQTNGLGTDTPTVKWLLGEDTTGLGAVRNMSNPTAPGFGDPDRIGSSLYYKGESDNGGVHSNSGVNNKAVYLMVDGGTFNGKTVKALGWDKTAAIYYEAQTNLLGTASNYSDLYYALQQACSNLAGGAQGVTADDCLEVRKALEAVQMNNPVTGTTSNQITAPLCPTGMTTNVSATTLNETFDDATDSFIYSGWSKSSSLYNSPPYSILSSSGDRVFQRLTLDSEVYVQPNSFLHFNHSYDFEYDKYGYWDGGVLEYSTDNGSTWVDAGSLFSAGAGYNGTLGRYATNGNQLQGRRAFVGTVFPYYVDPTHMVSSRFNLSSLVNKNVKFRFVYGTDNFVYWRGWIIDDVKIYQCVGTPSIPVLQTPANNSLVTSSPLLNWSDSVPALHHYQVQVDDTSDFSSPVYDNEFLTISQDLLTTDLDPDRTYYWRVQALNAIGDRLGWSPTWIFRTALLPPVLASPLQNEHILTLRPTFNWEDVPNATGYTIQISTTSTFAAPILGSPMLSTFTPAKDLPKGLLYWRVQTRGANGPGAWSEVRSYNGINIPPAPALTAPVNNLLVTDYTPTFTWKPVVMPGVTVFQKYQIQVDDDQAFGSPAIDAGALTNSHTALTDLLPNTKYYWRVRTFNTLDEISNWSTVLYFRTALTPPVLTAPVEASQELTLRPSFEWEAVPNATGYTIQIAKNSAFTLMALTANTTTSSYVPTVNLPPAIPLYWRVLATGTNGPSAPAIYRSFTSANPPSVPVLSLPAVNSLSTDYTPLFKWSIVSVPLNTAFGHYQLQVDDDPAFGSPEVNDETSLTSAGSNQLESPVSLAPDTKYYWRVRAFNNQGESSLWSASRYFRTALTPPVLTSPAEPFEAPDLRPAFEWEDVPNATGYTIQIAKNDTFTLLVHTGNPVSSSYTPTVNLPANLTLYWRVLATGTNGPSAPSTVRSFHSANPPSVPVLSLPAINALSTDYTPLFKWSAVTVPTPDTFGHYQLQVDNDPAFGSPEINDETLTVPQLDSAISLAPDTKYYWRVRSFNNQGESSLWSAAWYFRTALTPPVLTSPEEPFEAPDLRPSFEWEDVPNATGYTIQIAKNNTFTLLVHTGSPVSSSYTPTVNLPANLTLYWRVLAKGVNGPSAPSTVRSFHSANPPTVPVLSLPAANFLSTDYTPTFKWTIVSVPLGAAFGHYQLQVDDDPAFGSPEVNDETLTSAASIQLESPVSLIPNTKYYWRVRSFNSDNETLGWSASRYFRTALTPPVLTSPADPFEAPDLRPTFEWEDVPNAASYTIQIAPNTSFIVSTKKKRTSTLTINTTVSSYTPTANLLPNVTLYWRVFANGTNGPSAPSTVRSFHSANPPSVPVLSLPALNALSTDYTPLFKWTAVTVPAPDTFGHYQLQVDDDPAFGSPEVNDETLTSATSIQLESPVSLTPNTKYYWRVRSFNTNNETLGWSASRYFRTALTPPVLTTPLEASHELTLRPSFVWEAVPNATGYTIQIAKNNTFTLLVHTGNPVSSSYTPTANLPPNLTLYWRVFAKGTNGPSAPAEYRSFLSPNPPSVPVLSLPGVNALSTDYTPLFKWSVSLPATVHHYQLQVDNDQAFGSPEINDETLTVPQLDSAVSLAPDTKYYWRVRSFNNQGESSLWSASRYFRTALTPPVLTSPAEPFEAPDLRPAFEWEDVPNATGYTIQIAKNNTFTLLALTANTVTSSYTPTANLPANLTLYWRVLATGANGPSAPSTVRSFHGANPPSVPVLSLPAVNALSTDYTPSFKWTIVSVPLGASFGHYQLQVDDDPAFGSPEVNDETLTSAASIQLESPVSLTPDTKYYWRVRSFNNQGESSLWSASRYFRTALTPPVLISPAEPFEAPDPRPAFEWEDVPNATGYTIQIAKNNTFTLLVHTGNPVSSSYIPTANLPANLTLYWRVLAKGTNGPSAPSTVRSFHSANPPSVPVLSLPAVNALSTDYTPLFKWSIVSVPVGASFGHYQLQVDDDPAFGSPEVNDETLTSAASIQLESPVSLAPNAKFYWRVRSFNSDNETNGWSVSRYFRTALTPPVLASPANATAVGSLTPTFDWSDVPNATGYTIQVSTSSTFSTLLVNASMVSSTYTPVTALPSGYVVFWRVRTNGANGPSDWTTTILFTTP